MKYIIGLKLTEDSSKAINKLIRACKSDPFSAFRPIHPDYPTIIPIGRSKQELPSESCQMTVPLENPRLHVFDTYGVNQHSSLQLLFQSDWVQNQLFERAGIDPATASKGARKKHRPRVLLGFFCRSWDMGWIKHLTVNELHVAERISIPFDPYFPHYAYRYISHDEVATKAQQLWEDAGRPEGRDQEFWYAAEYSVRREGRH